MESDHPVHKGYLMVALRENASKKSWHEKFCMLYKRSSIGIERIEIFDSEKKNRKDITISLDDVLLIIPKPFNVFSILTKNAEYEFGSFEDDVLDIWFPAVYSIAFPGEISKITSNTEIDLYSATDKDVFYVELYPTDASKTCDLGKKHYILMLTSTALQLRTETNGFLLYSWSYFDIRKYGYKNGLFSFEAGRRCQSGEGTFLFGHPKYNTIYECLRSKMEKLSSSSPSLSSPPEATSMEQESVRNNIVEQIAEDYLNNREQHTFSQPKNEYCVLIGKSWQKKFCVLHRRSSSGVGRMELYESEKRVGQAKIIILEDVIKITPKSAHMFSILTKNAEYKFGSLTDDILTDWLPAVQNVAFPDTISQNQVEEDDNEIYASSDEGVFYVKLHPSDASKRCHLVNKNYTLVLTTIALQIRTETEGKLLYTWPYKYIRRYGCKFGLFTFEAGRKCASGEGIFLLEHPSHHKIYNSLASKMKDLKSYVFPSMPPFENVNMMKQLGRNASQKSLSSINKSKPVLPMVTVGPERDYEDISSEEFFSDENIHFKQRMCNSEENIFKAWKNTNIEKAKQSLSDTEDDYAEYASWGDGNSSRSTSNLLTKRSRTPVPDQYYDHLNFFGSTSKLNVSPGYEQVLPPPPPINAPPELDNVYQEVQQVKQSSGSVRNKKASGSIKKR